MSWAAARSTASGTPSGPSAEDEAAQRFDLLLLRTELAKQAAISMVKHEMLLIEALQGKGWWADVTVPMLEVVRRRLRALIKLIERRARKVVYSDFEDQIGETRQVLLSGVTPVGTDFERFRAKARSFLRAHQDRIALQEPRRNQPPTATDLEQLERLLGEARGSLAEIARARETSAGLATFVRSLVGLDRAAAKDLFNEFLVAGTATANQIEFLILLIEHLTEQGVMDAARLYESPFTDLSPAGPEALFSAAQVDTIVAVLHEVRAKVA